MIIQETGDEVSVYSNKTHGVVELYVCERGEDEDAQIEISPTRAREVAQMLMDAADRAEEEW